MLPYNAQAVQDLQATFYILGRYRAKKNAHEGRMMLDYRVDIRS